MMLWLIAGGLAGFAGMLVTVKALRRMRRRKLLAAPPPASWLPILQSTLPVIDRLSEEQRRQLFARMQLFLAEKKFVGCGGLEISETIRVTIAAQAFLLLL